MRLDEGMDEIRITAPGPGLCPVCATRHDERDPHDRDSLYYQNLFYKEHKRFPSWWDAMSHCSELTKLAWIGKLQRRGVSVSAPVREEADDGE